MDAPVLSPSPARRDASGGESAGARNPARGQVRDREVRRALARCWAETSRCCAPPTWLHGEPARHRGAISHTAGFSWRYLRFVPGLLSAPQVTQWIEAAHPTRAQQSNACASPR